MLADTTTRHPAKFTDAILDAAADLLGPGEGRTMYDPFAGTGKGVDYFCMRGWDAIGTELEPEWASQSMNVACMDAFKYMALTQMEFDCVFTSPAYGNRMADHHEAKDDSRRNTYRHALGRPLSDNSSAGLQWGDEYRSFHETAWELVHGVLRPGGHFLLNVKDHIRKGERVPVASWHYSTCIDLGFTMTAVRDVPVNGNRQGANGAARVGHEWLYLFVK